MTQAAPVAAASLRRANFLFLSLVGTVVVSNLPYGSYALYPFKIFATWLHESSHGVVMLLTGAGFAKMEIFRDTSGLAYPSSGVGRMARAAISSAGYMGTSFFGAMFLVLGRTERGARTVLGVLGALMALSAVLYVRNQFGIAAVLVGGAALLAIAFKASEAVAGFLLNLIAMQSCINALFDIKVLFSASMFVNGQETAHQSDAHQVARALGGPYWLWAALWLAWSFALFYLAFRRVRLREGTVLGS